MTHDFGAYERIPIGKTLYLYRRRAKPGEKRRDLAILAHGAYVAATDATADEPHPPSAKSMKVPPGVTLYLYAPEGMTLEFVWQKFAGRRYAPLRAAKEGDSIPVYFLQKLESVAHLDETKSAGRATPAYLPLRRFSQRSAHASPPPMDILTVRNRVFLNKDLDLKRVLSKVFDRGYTYDRVHAGFCTAPVNHVCEPKVYGPVARARPLRDRHYQDVEDTQADRSSPVKDIEQAISDLDDLMKTCAF